MILWRLEKRQLLQENLQQQEAEKVLVEVVVLQENLQQQEAERQHQEEQLQQEAGDNNKK